MHAAVDGTEIECRCRGDHHCQPRAQRARAFFAELLVHTKGRWARTKFSLAAWQFDEFIAPMFGDVTWSTEWGRYVRRYRVAWLELARKNGKSELLAGIALYLLVADDEEGAEIYGAACDRDQARKVFDVAARMVQLSPVLAARLQVKAHAKRIVDERTASFYEVIAADAAGNLGHNPHGVVFDEILTQPSGALWDALRTGMGTREQPLLVAATTAGNDPTSFAAVQHAEMVRIAEDPERARHVLVVVKNTPMDADPWDEANWTTSNPALGDFLSIQSLRDEALEARNDPTKENSFRQFRLNQWVQQSTRWMPLHLWDACGGLVVERNLAGRDCYGGLDLAAVSDLTSLCWFFPATGDAAHVLVWRHFVPEAVVAELDSKTGGQFDVWCREGTVTVTEGEVVDYDAVHAQIANDYATFACRSLGIDRWNSTGTTNWLAQDVPKLQVQLVGQGFVGMSPPSKELMRLVQSRQLNHGGNPVARWCFDAVEVKQDPAENIKPIKPDRQRSGKRIDAVVSAVMAIDGWMRRPVKSTYGVAGF